MIEHVCVFVSVCVLYVRVCVRGRDYAFMCVPFMLCTSDLIHQSHTDNSNADKQSETNPGGSLLIPTVQ